MSSRYQPGASPRPSTVGTTVGDVYAACWQDEAIRERLGKVYALLFGDAGDKPDHFAHVKPSRARCDTSAVADFVVERFGKPRPSRDTPFGYLAIPVTDGWVALFAVLAYGEDQAIARDFEDRIARTPWSSGGRRHAGEAAPTYVSSTPAGSAPASTSAASTTEQPGFFARLFGSAEPPPAARASAPATAAAVLRHRRAIAARSSYPFHKTNYLYEEPYTDAEREEDERAARGDLQVAKAREEREQVRDTARRANKEEHRRWMDLDAKSNLTDQEAEEYTRLGSAMGARADEAAGEVAPKSKPRRGPTGRLARDRFDQLEAKIQAGDATDSDYDEQLELASQLSVERDRGAETAAPTVPTVRAPSLL